MDDPVAFIDVTHRTLEWARPTRWETPTVVHMPFIPLYIAPPKKEWFDLTEEEIEDLTSVMFEEPSNEEVIDFALRVQAKLKEKNNGNN